MSPSIKLLQLGAYGLLVATLPLFVAPGLWLVSAIAGVCLVGCMLIDLWTLRHCVPEFAVALSQRVDLGEEAIVIIRVLPRSREKLRVRIWAEAAGALAPGEGTLLVTEGEASECKLVLQTPRRGEGELTAVWAESTSRLGLFHRIARISTNLRTLIVPNLSILGRIATRRLASSPAGDQPAVRQQGAGTEFDELRAYMPGMDVRAIDWKSSARHRDLRIRHFRAEQNHRLILTLDVGRRMLEPIDSLTRLDHAVHIALAVARVALRSGDAVGLQAYGIEPETWVQPATGARQFNKLLSATIKLQPTTRESNPHHAVREIAERVQRRSLVVVLTDLREPTAARCLARAVGHLGRAHLVFVVALVDPATDENWGRPPRDFEQVGRSLIHATLQREATRAVQLVRASGGEVVTATPDKAAAAILHRYFRLRGSLG